MRARLISATAFLLAAANTGCFDIPSNDQAFYQVTGGPGTGGSAGTGGTGGTTNTGGSGGTTTTTTTTVPLECVPANAAGAVGDECGVFVSSSLGNDDNNGKKASPFATIGKALESAGDKPIYLCNETFTEALSVGVPTTIYGALDCAGDWKYLGDTSRSTITSEEDTIPLRVRTDQSLTAFNIKVIAVNAKKAGGSSIAILAEVNATLDLSKSDAESGSGAAGEDAADIEGMAKSGVVGTAGGAACSASTVVGAEAPVNECGDPDSVGGNGGNGTLVQGSTGGPGLPFTMDNFGGGENDVNNCGNGKVGTTGAPGTPGTGASGAIGTLDSTVGFVGVAGLDGQPGKPGQGGGGGGGAKGGTGATLCPVAGSSGGAGGGSGGTGGCGGLGGKGGGAAGSSLAIVSLGAKLTFSEVVLTANNGGTGGDGGDGQLGGPGGTGGAGGTVQPAMTDLNPACKGGTGGAGGKGGYGGGGLGGHSLGIAYVGDAPDLTGATVNLGMAGEGGLGETMEYNGDPGVAKNMQAF